MRVKLVNSIIDKPVSKVASPKPEVWVQNQSPKSEVTEAVTKKTWMIPSALPAHKTDKVDNKNKDMG